MRKYFDILPPVFYPSASIALVFVGLTIAFNEEADRLFGQFQGFMSDQFGWLLHLSINYYVFFVLFLGFSRLGSIRIGGADTKPEFSRFSWVAMLFSAGMGIGLVYFSVAEPMLNFNNPIQSDFNDLEKARYAMRNTFFHYGFHVWGIYSLLGIALAYFTFSRKLPLSLRSTLYPLLGERIYGPVGHAIDILAVLATLFGLATSLGFGAIQFSTGVSRVFGATNGVSLQVISITGITLIAIVSLLSGIGRGIRLLSTVNILLAVVLFFFVLLVGRTSFLLNGFVETLGIYLDDYFQMSTFRGTYSDSGDWFTGWSIFYWAWWISWSPFVGTFIARISKGRTIREMALFGLILPALGSFLWMSIFGGTALDLQLSGSLDLAGAVAEDSSQGLFMVLEHLPLGTITSVLSIFLVGTFFITSSDSGSLVVDLMTSGGTLDSPGGQKVFWASLEGAVAIALLVGGGLSALQSASISTGFPFAVVLVLVSWSLIRALRTEKQ